MRSFTSTELDRMQAAQESGMMDRGVVLHYVETDRLDEYGTPVGPYVEGALIDLGFDGSPKEEHNAPAGGGDTTQAEGSEVKFRLPLDTRISNLDRIKVTERFGELVADPVTYELLEAPRRGPSGLTARAKRVM